jgi:hypothetical protein
MSTAVETKSRDAHCDCGEAAPLATPLPVTNRPGLPSIAYRVGTHATFRASMIASLTRSDLPALQALTSREPNDFSLALIDAWATVGDVLAFYQERIANEAYLRTATERFSIGHLARLIGYELRPGVAATTLLAFDLETAPGAPPRSVVDCGTRVQSVPGPKEAPQIFETTESIDARPLWNALKPRLAERRYPEAGDTWIYLEGVTTQLKPGDALLLVGLEREGDPRNDNWDVRRVVRVEADSIFNRTRVYWDRALGVPTSGPTRRGAKVFALRQRASVFGHNAQQWDTLAEFLRKTGGPFADKTKWAEQAFASGTTTIDLDAVYNQIAPESWIVLTEDGGYVELFRVKEAAETSVAKYNLSGKCTRLVIEGENIEKFSPRGAGVLGHSEPLAIAEAPFVSLAPDSPSTGIALSQGALSPVEGHAIALDRLVEGLEKGKVLVVSGQRIHVEVDRKVDRNTLALTSASGAFLAYLQAGDVLETLGAPVPSSAGVQWHLRNRDGIEGYATSPAGGAFNLVPALKDAPVVSEVLVVAEAKSLPTTLVLEAPLAYSYDRATVLVYANVAPATHGEAVNEVLGSGNAAQPYQRFALRQAPLTYVGAANASGAESTLEVRVNDVKWHEVETLLGRGPRDRVFVARTDDAGVVTVLFGDGAEGARVPTGVENVRATYRKGIGRGGNLGAGQLSLLLTRPLGVRGVKNPLAASGGDDRERLEDARSNAGLTIKALDRVVSLLDYENFARAFAGVAKASAAWIWDGRERTVFLTVAGAGGAEIATGSDRHTKLVAALKHAGDPNVPVRVQSYRKAYFDIGIRAAIHPDYVKAKVLANVEADLRAAFAFDARAFAEPVTRSEVTTIAQRTEGVVAVVVTRLYRTGTPPASIARLAAEGAKGSSNQPPVAAELLTLNGAPLQELGEMT